jgi:hypothetical protein
MWGGHSCPLRAFSSALRCHPEWRLRVPIDSVHMQRRVRRPRCVQSDSSFRRWMRRMLIVRSLRELALPAG